MARLAPILRLRGRELELGAVGDAFDRVASGHPATVLVEGEAGIGKTRLLAEVLDDARGRGLEVVTGRAQELERTRPFGVLADTFACTGSSPDPRRRAIAGLLATRAGDRGPLTVSSDPGLQFQAVDAFGHRCRPRPACPGCSRPATSATGRSSGSPPRSGKARPPSARSTST